MNITNDEKYMQKALELAGRARGRTSPNPLVGAVVVKNGVIVGDGYHEKAGTPHAEVHALKAAGNETDGATLYVTLEPCSHYGKTPPCTEAIIKSGIKEVIVATLDPNPKVAGQGIKVLQQAGIATKVGIMEKVALRQNEVFFKHITSRQPFICLKYAMTMDGKIATHSGDSKWISNEASRYYVHELRNIYDAILVGIGTVLADNPTLNTRLDIAHPQNPSRIIIDGNLEIPLDSNIVKTSNTQKTIIFTALKETDYKAKHLMEKGIEVINVGGTASKLNLLEIVNQLGAKGITSLLVEGGGQINASFLENKLVDKILCFIAPKIVGGMAPSPVSGVGVTLIKDAYQFEQVEIDKLGDDILIKAYIRW